MKINCTLRGIGLAAGLWAAPAPAQEPPEPVLLTVLGTNYTAKELGVEIDSPPDLLVARTFLKIQSGIMGAYAEKLNYQPSVEELKEYCRRSAPTPAEMSAIFGHDPPVSWSAERIFETIWEEWQREADDPSGAMKMAAQELKEWKFTQTLFAQYGGRVYVDPYLVPGVPEAARAHLAVCETARDFTIHDESLRNRYWELMRTPSPFPLVSEEEGRAALAEHPADRQKRQVVKGLTEHFQSKQRLLPDHEQPSRSSETTLP